jgi:L-seryl-tRNA(Ser) seleniumtransferase
VTVPRGAPTPPETSPVYRALGVRRAINAADTYTILGGSRLPDEVLDAVTQAAGHHVHVDELLAAVGRRIAELLGVPAAHPVNGAAAGLTVAAAACLAGDDPGRVGRLPESLDGRNQLVVLRCQRNPYDRALLAAGAQLVEVGFADSTPLWSLTSAIGERTAGVVYYAGDQLETYAPSLEEVARIAHDRGVPLVVDAAAQFPPVSNLWRYLERGADLVLFSGGKGLKGMQSSGLVVGREDLVRACAANSYPHHSVGRAMKSSKEAAVGLLAAVERALAMDWDAEYARWQVLLVDYQAALADLAAVRTWLVPTGRLGQTCPRLFLEWSGGGTAGELADALEAQDPSVVIGVDRPGSRQAYVNPYSVLPDEEDYLISALAEQLEVVVNR